MKNPGRKRAGSRAGLISIWIVAVSIVCQLAFALFSYATPGHWQEQLAFVPFSSIVSRVSGEGVGRSGGPRWRTALRPRGKAAHGIAKANSQPLGFRNTAYAAATAVAGKANGLSARQLYMVGIGWYLCHFAIGIGNDAIMKILANDLPAFQIVLLRFVSAAVVLVPLLTVRGGDEFRTTRIWMHGFRGLLLALGIGLWCLGLSLMPFASCVVINNTMPFFKMTLARIFLNERVGKERWLASLGGFLGCLLIFNPSSATFDPRSLVLILSAFCFAILDIFNKKYSSSESIVSMLFYGSIATALVSAPIALQNWVPLTYSQFGLVAALGCGANLLLLCLLKAFQFVDASATCPYRYTEFVLSAILGFLAFGEKPTLSTLIGSCIIIPSVVFCALRECQNQEDEP